MSNFLKSLFGNDKKSTEEELKKEELRKFDFFKFDGVRAINMNKTDYAIKCFTNALNIQYDQETAEFLAQAYLTNNNINEAQETYETIMTYNDDQAMPHYNLALIAFKKNDFDETIKQAQAALKHDGHLVDAYILAGRAYHAKKDDINAIIQITKGIQLNEEDTAGYLLRAEILKDMSSPTEALADVEKVLSVNSSDEDALILRGNIYERRNEKNKAEADYRKVIELNPFCQDAYLKLSKMMITTKQLDEVIALLDEAIDINPAFSEAYAERGRAKLANGNKEGSIADLKKSLEINPETEESINGSYNNLMQKNNAALF